MLRTSLFLVSFVAVSQTALALSSVDSRAGLFTDVRSSSDRAAVLSLMEHGIIRSSDKFWPGRSVNRAEFAKMIVAFGSGALSDTYDRSCFADVERDVWYEAPVCRLKKSGIVQGYGQGNVRLFMPAQTITYAEAVSILFQISDFGKCTSGSRNEPWYTSCLRGTHAQILGLTFTPDTRLTRLEAARLLKTFVDRVDPRSGTFYSSSSLSSSRSSSSSSASSLPLSSSSSRSSSSSSSMASSVSSSAGTNDQYGDTSIRSQFLLLGEVSPVLASAKAFLYEESFNVTKISVTLTSVVSSVDSLLIFDQDRRLLGRATLDSSGVTGRTYALAIANGSFTVPQRQEVKVYVRAQLATKEQGGVSNALVQVESFKFNGFGEWSTNPYTMVSNEVFQPFVTARSTITQVRNTDQKQAQLLSGTQRRVGSFEFTGKKSDATARINLTRLTFSVEKTGGVDLSNVKLGADGTNETYECTTTASVVTCLGIPEMFGSLTDQPRVLTLYGDISIPLVSTSASLRLTLNEAGTVSTAGSVGWSDGTSAFSWIGLQAPVVEGTYWKY